MLLSTTVTSTVPKNYHHALGKLCSLPSPSTWFLPTELHHCTAICALSISSSELIMSHRRPLSISFEGEESGVWARNIPAWSSQTSMSCGSMNGIASSSASIQMSRSDCVGAGIPVANASFASLSVGGRGVMEPCSIRACRISRITLGSVWFKADNGVGGDDSLISVETTSLNWRGESAVGNC